MKKYIVSDIHGNGDIYNSIMGYLDNVSLVDDVTLYINGDLFDRGPDSLEVLLDTKRRIENNEGFKINYLGGNHELMMYQTLKKRKPGKWISHWCDWMLNGGWIIEGKLDCMEDGEAKCDELRDFVGNLKLYETFEETIGDKPILLVHASAPKKVENPCMKTISNTDRDTFHMVWDREKDEFGFRNYLGNKDYFTILGYTPVAAGFHHNKRENYLNIDGGCAGYAVGQFQYQYVPLIEIMDDYIIILLFNHNNEIVKGFQFDGRLWELPAKELEKRKEFIDHTYDNQQEKYKQKVLEILQ